MTKNWAAPVSSPALLIPNKRLKPVSHYWVTKKPGIKLSRLAWQRVTNFYTEQLMFDRYRLVIRGRRRMAGIGFELRRILRRESYTATLQAYIYAGLISSGPWVLSILSVLFIGILSIGMIAPDFLVCSFGVRHLLDGPNR